MVYQECFTRSTFSAAALGVLLFATAAQAGGPRARFTQLDWKGDDGVVEFADSNVAQVEIFLGGQSPCHGGSPLDPCFVNLFVEVPGGSGPGWVVQNLPLWFEDAARQRATSPVVHFPLNVLNGTDVATVNFILDVSLDPVEDWLPSTSELKKTRVSSEEYLVGGRIGGMSAGGGSGSSNLVFSLLPVVNFFGLPFEPVVYGATSVSAKKIAKIDEEINHCAPSAAARSIDYLTDSKPLGGAQDVADDLADDMNTTEAGGTSDADMEAGKDQYSADNDLGIETDVSYHEPDTSTFGTYAGGIAAQLADGADVEILISWTGGGGHAAMVTSILTLPDGSAVITYVDDPNQGDGRAENEEHVILVNPDGTFAGGRVDGFMTETN